MEKGLKIGLFIFVIILIGGFIVGPYFTGNSILSYFDDLFGGSDDSDGDLVDSSIYIQDPPKPGEKWNGFDHCNSDHKMPTKPEPEPTSPPSENPTSAKTSVIQPTLKCGGCLDDWGNPIVPTDNNGEKVFSKSCELPVPAGKHCEETKVPTKETV